MYYVVRSDEGLENYAFTFDNIKDAKESAMRLKRLLGHQYSIIKVETVWTTQTLDEAMRG
jgi:hypothetical protein